MLLILDSDEVLDDFEEDTDVLLTLPAAALDELPTALPAPVQAAVNNVIAAMPAYPAVTRCMGVFMTFLNYVLISITATGFANDEPRPCQLDSRMFRGERAAISRCRWSISPQHRSTVMVSPLFHKYL
jgi:hypothetical protein